MIWDSSCPVVGQARRNIEAVKWRWRFRWPGVVLGLALSAVDLYLLLSASTWLHCTPAVTTDRHCLESFGREVLGIAALVIGILVVVGIAIVSRHRRPPSQATQ